MGGASSKAARRLPTTTPTAVRSVDPHLPPREPLASPDPLNRVQSASLPPSSGAELAVTQESPRELGPRVHSKLPFSGEKDDAIRRDALDPDFASNLSQLGPVYVPHPSRTTPPALAQRTLAARQSQAERTDPSSAGSLDAATLSGLLRKLQGVPQVEAAAICGEHGVDPAQIHRLRRWIAVPAEPPAPKRTPSKS